MQLVTAPDVLLPFLSFKILYKMIKYATETEINPNI